MELINHSPLLLLCPTDKLFNCVQFNTAIDDSKKKNMYTGGVMNCCFYPVHILKSCRCDGIKR